MPIYTITTDQTLTTLIPLPALPAGTKLAIVQGLVVGFELPDVAQSLPKLTSARKQRDIPHNVALVTQQLTLHPEGLKTYEMCRNLQLENGELNSTVQHMLKRQLICPAYAVAKGQHPRYILCAEQA